MPKAPQNERTWIEISAKNLRHNLALFRSLLGASTPIWVLKANAYGHGLSIVANEIEKTMKRGEWYGVDSIEEARALRESGVKSPIIVMGYVVPGRLNELVSLSCRYLISSSESIKELSKVRGSHAVRLHLKIDTGTSRQGALPKDVFALAREAKKKGFIIEGAATHFANIEEPHDRAFAVMQYERFIETVTELRSKGFELPMLHTACTAAVLLDPRLLFSGSRIGIGTYGVYPSDEIQSMSKKLHSKKKLLPVLSWRTHITLVKEIPVETPIGYGLTEKTKRRTILAVVPVGYADGFDRRLSSKGHVLIRGKRAKVMGRVCMNMCMVDVTDIPGVRQNDVATLIGDDAKAYISTDELAGMMNTVSYEVLARLNPSIPRYVVE